ncbi:hypothetical protein PSAB6_30234 [Paraburkholderia sabiae]|nr:hypothetical protein PSAB6_30234 [Paraburkholderia sabiae]
MDDGCPPRAELWRIDAECPYQHDSTGFMTFAGGRGQWLLIFARGSARRPLCSGVAGCVRAYCC